MPDQLPCENLPPAPVAGAIPEAGEENVASTTTSASPEADTAAIEAPAVATKPEIPAFARVFHKEDAMVPASSRLVLFLPKDETRPQPVRVIERRAINVKWYAIQTWHENVQRWIDRENAVKRAEAIRNAHAMAWLADANEG